MLPKEMWELLLQHRVYVLATGDPGQLPPIDPKTDNHVLDHPHIFLDEIMRQAMDSEIIRLSMWIREGNSLETFPCEGDQVKVISSRQLVSGMYTWADQIICATNAKRIEINDYFRKLKGFGPEPTIGDKVIGLSNHWEYLSRTGNWALTNGTIGTITNFSIQQFRLPYYISRQPIDYMFTDIVLEDGDSFLSTPIDYVQLKTGVSALTPQQIFQINKNNKLLDAPFDFTYAYAITGHKSQGSEYKNVLAYEERFPFSAEDHKRWLYTVATRAEEKLVMVKGE